ncbi:GDYXXLXY domain-containing protein [Ferviditalea candida]|uniref:GDYXXLXY domain-containing protein n=1 Tax=Ferviditalea candida TaxID=3108399 RepID=A0ABU5ZGQ7_9BACL|nr:GDYXXLXY domain-containing protein [Paenibacillaceae bacterium T2]
MAAVPADVLFHAGNRHLLYCGAVYIRSVCAFGIRGKVGSADAQHVWVKYGLERYYVPEGTGQGLEEQRSELLVRVRVAPWGQAKINGFEPEEIRQN